MKKPTLKQLLISRKNKLNEIEDLRVIIRASRLSHQILQLRREVYAIDKEINKKL